MPEAAELSQLKAPAREVMAWAMFDFAATVFAMNVMSRFALLWLKEEKGGVDLHMSIAVVASLTAASLVNLALAPVSDAQGRRAIYVRIFGLLCVVATAGLGTNPPLALALVFIALANFASQSASIFWVAMLPDVSTSQTLGKISGFSVALGYAGSITGLLVVEWLRPEGASATMVFVPTAVLVLLTALPQFLLVRDHHRHREVAAGPALRHTWQELLLIGRLVWERRKLRWFMLAMLVYMDVHGTVTIFMAGYARFAMQMGESRGVFLGLSEISLFLIVGTVFAVVGAWLIGLGADRTDKCSLLQAVLGVWSAALLLAVLADSKWAFWVAGPMIGIAMGGMWVLSRALLVELGWAEHRTKLFTVFGLVGRTAGIVGPLVWGLTMHLAEPLGERLQYRIALGTLLGLMLVAMGFMRKAIREPLV